MKHLLLLFTVLLSLNLFAQDDLILTDLPKNADETKVRFVHKVSIAGAAADHFERAECLFKNTTLLMKNYNAYGAEFDAENQVMKIKVKEKLDTGDGLKYVFYEFGVKALDGAYALKVEEIRFMPNSVPIEFLDHEEEDERAKARSQVNRSKKPEIIKAYTNQLAEKIEARFANFETQFAESKNCKKAVKDEDDW